MGHGAAGLVTVPGETSLTPCEDPTGGVIKRAGGRDRGQTLNLNLGQRRSALTQSSSGTLIARGHLQLTRWEVRV